MRQPLASLPPASTDISSIEATALSYFDPFDLFAIRSRMWVPTLRRPGYAGLRQRVP
jgi:hypothetical protein